MYSLLMDVVFFETQCGQHVDNKLVDNCLFHLKIPSYNTDLYINDNRESFKRAAKMVQLYCTWIQLYVVLLNENKQILLNVA